MSKSRKRATSDRRAAADAKSATTKARAKTKAKARAIKATPPIKGSKPRPRDPLDPYVEAAALALDLKLEAAWKPMIKANLAVTLAFARMFDDLPLPDDTEPAPVFMA